MRLRTFWCSVGLLALLAGGCSASGDSSTISPHGTGGSGGGGGADGGADGGAVCNLCFGGKYTPCTSDGQPGAPVACPDACAPGFGCVACVPGSTVCVGNEVHRCAADGSSAEELVETCDTNQGMVCSQGQCGDACTIAADQASNVGCEFWAVDLDQQDAVSDPSAAPWGVVLSNASSFQANVTIEVNEAPPGQPPQTKVVQQVSVKANDLQAIVLPTRWLDCGPKPNDYTAPGTCLSSNAYRITSSAPIVVSQFNTFTNAWSNDASLLLPTNALGKAYRVLGWPAGHPTNVFGVIDRSYVTIVGTKPNTQVKVSPTFRLRGNPPIAATDAGGELVATIGPFDVLNLESDDATLQEASNWGTDLSGSSVEASQPVAVFSGVESAASPDLLQVPTYPGWDSNSTCCLDHLEDQLMPAESIGTHYAVGRSPIRSTGAYHEPDVIRFVGVAEPANVTTSLPAPFDQFTIQPGEVKTTWTQGDIVVSSDKPVMVGQILVSQDYVDGPYVGDPSLTVFPAVEQYRTEYVVLVPPSWTSNWVVIEAPVGASVTIDGNATTSCTTRPTGTLEGVAYESRTCALVDGVHRLSGDQPFGITNYGYGSAGSYAVAGGAAVKHIYDPPPLH